MSAGTSSQLSAHTAVIPPPSGCTYLSAVFDREGTAALEGCSEGARHGLSGLAKTYLGNAYLVQLNNRREVVLRVPLKLGPDSGTLAAIPGSAWVLVSENQARTATDWVWEFNGQRLRLIKRYPAAYARVIAIPG